MLGSQNVQSSKRGSKVSKKEESEEVELGVVLVSFCFNYHFITDISQ